MHSAIRTIQRSCIPEFLISAVLVLGAFRVMAQQPTDDAKVKSFKDLAYYQGADADEKKHKLDLYLPKDRKNFPVVMFVHGGAWRSGDRALYPRLGNAFAREGYGTVVISYRLTPTVYHPGHIEDVARAFAWVHENIAKYGGNTKRLFVAGHSAGAHLVALLALNEKYLKQHGLNSKDIAGVLALSGPYRVNGNLLGVFGGEESGWKDASPMDHVREGAPPFLLIYAEHDFIGLPASAKDFHAALKGKKVETMLTEIKDRNHISIITSIDGKSDETREAMLKFLREQTEKSQRISQVGF